MSDHSAIEWTDATWNPVAGCSKVSPGCAHCYAERLSLRFGHSKKPWKPENAEDNVTLHPERLEIPLRWRTPRRVFVNSMSDLFHELVPFEFIDQVFAVMAIAPQHTFQVLTKRPERMRAYIAGKDRDQVVWLDRRSRDGGIERVETPITLPLPNVWLGVSAENQYWADQRIPILLDTPATVRFVSAEPLLGPIDFTRITTQIEEPALYAQGGACSEVSEIRPRQWPALDWIIVGGESGPQARLMDPDWARSIRDQCVAAGVPYFFKQHGGRTPKAGGRELDGRTWDGMPQTREV